MKEATSQLLLLLLLPLLLLWGIQLAARLQSKVVFSVLI